MTKFHEALRYRSPIVVTDCKSLYDHVKANTSPSTLDDKRCAIDVIVIRDCLIAAMVFSDGVPLIDSWQMR